MFGRLQCNQEWQSRGQTKAKEDFRYTQIEGHWNWKAGCGLIRSEASYIRKAFWLSLIVIWKGKGEEVKEQAFVDKV